MKRVLSICLSVLLVAFSPEANAQVVPQRVTPLTLSASTVATGTTSAITSQAFTINPRSGFAVVPTFVLGGAGTSNITFSFQVSVDGVNWTTTTPFTFSVAANGTTPVIAFYNFPPHIAGSGADNVAWVRLASVQNANGTTGSTLTVNNINITIDY
jgi:hypothetical protein